MRRHDRSEVFAQRARISRMACCFKHTMRYFKENEIKMIPTAKRIQDEIEDLTSAKNAGYTEYRESQKREKELQTVKVNIEKMLRQQEPETELNRKMDELEL